MKFLYYLYQFLFVLPTGLLLTFLTAIVTVVGCLVGSAHFWGYYPGKLWSWAICRMLLLPIHVEGRENIRPEQSYVFVANHQGPMDIFLIYGFLNRNFKWMMKKALRRIFLVGYACERAHHIFVDKSGPKKIQRTIDNARLTLQNGTSLVVFPEGSRTFTGHMGRFRKGAFQLADELRLPVVPITIDGSFDVLPRTKGFNFVSYHPMRLIIHRPIPPKPQDEENIRHTMEESYHIIMAALPKRHQGYVENKDQ